MKNFKVFLCVMSMVFGMVSYAEATPVYYTFEGRIGLIDDDLNLAADLGLTTQTIISYTFLADFEQPGIILNPDGTIDQRTDTSINDWFYTELTSQSILLGDDIDIFEGPGNKKYYDGQNHIFTDRVSGSMKTVFFNQNIESPYYGSRFQAAISKYKFATDWVIGDITTGHESFETGGVRTRIDFLMELTSINPAPVPEPATMLLLGTGLVGIAAVGRKRFIKK